MSRTQIEIVTGILFLQMVFMTIEGDLKDLDSEEPCIPRALGTRVLNGGRKILDVSMEFLVLFYILSLAQTGMIILLAYTQSITLAALTALPAVSMFAVSVTMVKDGERFSEKRLKKKIVLYTCLFVTAFGLASLSYMNEISIAAIVAGTLAWGLGWQQALFGDSSYFA